MIFNKLLRLSMVFALVFSFLVQNAQAYTVQRITNADGGGSSNSYSGYPFVSRDGRYVIFNSNASNLVSGDTNGRQDIFLYNIEAGTTTIVSLADDESQSNSSSYADGISQDGRYVIFNSNASNLVSGDTNGTWDVFIRDTLLGTTELVSVSNTGANGNGYSYNAAMSPDARYIAFFSGASNLVVGDSNSREDIFIRDRIASTTEIISVKSDGTLGNLSAKDSRPAISDDGRYVVFISSASNIVDGDTNGADDAFIRDRTDITTEIVSEDFLGGQTIYGVEDNGPTIAISPNGRYVAFSSQGDLDGLNPGGYTIIYIKDTQTGELSIIESYQGESPNEYTTYPRFSADGNLIVFSSNSDNLTSDSNVDNYFYVWNMTLQKVERVSFTYTGSNPNNRCGYSDYADISSNGDFIVMVCRASNMVSDSDTNGTDDIFLVYPFEDDYGDADEAYFETEYNSDGARHRVFDSPTLYLGQTVDKELYAATSTDSLGDDEDGTDDEDGVYLPTYVFPGQELPIRVGVTGTGYLNIWSDNNNDQDWDDSGEQIADDESVSTGTTTITATFSELAITGDTTLRFRLTSATGTEYTGLARDGEVEDYQVTISADNDEDKVPDDQESIDSTQTTDSLNFLDTDGDLVPDYWEDIDGTDKSSSSSFKDTDSGGVPDYIEVTYFINYGLLATDENSASDDSRDSNGNGISDYSELLSGSDPLAMEDSTPRPSGKRYDWEEHKTKSVEKESIDQMLVAISSMINYLQTDKSIDLEIKKSILQTIIKILIELSGVVEN